MTKSVLRIAHILVCAAAATCVATAEQRTSNRREALGSGIARGAHVSPYDTITLTQIGPFSISPNRDWAAFQTRRAIPETNRYEISWFVVSTVGGAPLRIAVGGDLLRTVVVTTSASSPGWAPAMSTQGGAASVKPTWSPDGRWIIYPRQDGDRVNLWRSRVDGRRTEQITRLDGDVHPEQMVFAQDGQRLFFVTRLSQAQLRIGLNQEGLTGIRFEERFLSRARGPTALRDQPMTSLWVHDFSRGTQRPATEAEQTEHQALLAAIPIPQGRKSARDRIGIASSNGALAWREARNPTQQGHVPPVTIVAQPRGTTQPIVCTHPLCTSQLLTLELWRNDEELLFSRSEPGRTFERTLYAWRPGEDSAPREILRTRGGYDDLYKSSRNWDCAVVHERMICRYDDMRSPPRLVSINLDSGAINTLFDANPQWAQFARGADPEPIIYRTETGFEGLSYLVLPPDYRPGERLPLIINAYGCIRFDDVVDGVGDEFPSYAFAANRMAVLCHNIIPTNWATAASSRSPESGAIGQSPDNATMARFTLAMNAAVAELVERGIVDPSRIGATGLSFGGQFLEYAIIHSQLTAAIASGSFLNTSIVYDAPARTRLAFRAAGIQSSASPFFDERSISRNTNGIRTALLMNLSDYEYEQESITSMQDAGRAAEMYFYPGEFHIKDQPAHRLAVTNRNVDWMNFWLRGVESGLAGDNQQYVRWRAMREQQCRLFGPNGTERKSRPRGHDSLTDDELVPWYCRHGALKP